MVGRLQEDTEHPLSGNLGLLGAGSSQHDPMCGVTQLALGEPPSTPVGVQEATLCLQKGVKDEPLPGGSIPGHSWDHFLAGLVVFFCELWV